MSQETVELAREVMKALSQRGAETETAAGWMLKFRQRKLLRFRAFRDPERALEAAGLSE